MLPQILFFHRNKVITSIREPSRTSRAEQALPGSFTSGEKGLLAHLLGSFGSFMMLVSIARLVANLGFSDWFEKMLDSSKDHLCSLELRR